MKMEKNVMLMCEECIIVKNKYKNIVLFIINLAFISNKNMLFQEDCVLYILVLFCMVNINYS